MQHEITPQYILTYHHLGAFRKDFFSPPANYRVFIKYCGFSLKFVFCQFCCSAGVLPALCVYTHWRRGKTEKDRNILKSLEKTQYLLNTPYIFLLFQVSRVSVDQVYPAVCSVGQTCRGDRSRHHFCSTRYGVFQNHCLFSFEFRKNRIFFLLRGIIAKLNMFDKQNDKSSLTRIATKLGRPCFDYWISTRNAKNRVSPVVWKVSLDCSYKFFLQFLPIFFGKPY